MTGNPAKIISGGQTGADRAALDAAIYMGIPHGGNCPKGRPAEDGVLHERYQLTETESEGYRQRTKRNVLDSDGTLILNLGEFDGGTMSTERFTDKLAKPCLTIQLDSPGSIEHKVHCIRAWIEANQIKTLNVAGPRESKRPGIYQQSYKLLTQLLKRPG